MKTLGQRIRHYRKALKLTQKQLADLAGISQPTIADLERNDQATTRKLPAIAKALKITIGQLDPDFKAEWEDVGTPMNLSESIEYDLAPLLEAVEGSYHMLGLDKEAAAALLSLVLEVAKEQPTPSSGKDFHRIHSELEVRKFLKSKGLLSGNA